MVYYYYRIMSSHGVEADIGTGNVVCSICYSIGLSSVLLQNGWLDSDAVGVVGQLDPRMCEKSPSDGGLQRLHHAAVNWLEHTAMKALAKW